LKGIISLSVVGMYGEEGLEGGVLCAVTALEVEVDSNTEKANDNKGGEEHADDYSCDFS